MAGVFTLKADTVTTTAIEISGKPALFKIFAKCLSGNRLNDSELPNFFDLWDNGKSILYSKPNCFTYYVDSQDGGFCRISGAIHNSNIEDKKFDALKLKVYDNSQELLADIDIPGEIKDELSNGSDLLIQWDVCVRNETIKLEVPNNE